MRDPKRIRPFLEKLAEFWEKEPDQRFGQLIMNLSRFEGGFYDIWEWDVEEFGRSMVSYQPEEEMTISQLAQKVLAAMPVELAQNREAKVVAHMMAEERYRQLHPEEENGS